MMQMGWADKVILVTGCNNPFGIGAATAMAFALEKARVYLRHFDLTRAPQIYPNRFTCTSMEV